MLENGILQFLLKLSHCISLIPPNASKKRFMDVYHENPMYVHSIINIHNMSKEIKQSANIELQILSLFSDFRYFSLLEPLKYLNPLLQVRVLPVYSTRIYSKIFLASGLPRRFGCPSLAWEYLMPNILLSF